MKTAVIVTGFLRDNQTADRAFPQFFGKDGVDFFVTCWDLKSSGAPGGLSRDDFSIVSEEDVYDRYINPKKIQIVNYKEYCDNRPYTVEYSGREDDIMKVSPRAAEHFHKYAQRIVDMFYMNKKSAEIVNMNDYDLVVKLRHDMFIDKEFPIILDDKLHVDNHQQVLEVKGTVPDSVYKLLNHTDLNPYYMSYQVTWGSSQLMHKYMNLYDHIRKMYVDDNVDISAYEHAVSYYVQKIMRCKFEIHEIENYYHFVR